MHIRRVAALTLLCTACASSASAQDWEPRRGRSGDGVHLRVGRSYYLPADQVAPTTVVVIGASATIDGRVDHDLVVIGGRVRIGPTAQIRGEVTAVGGGVDVADAAEVAGRINDVSFVWPEWRFVFRDWWWEMDRGWWAVLGLVGTAVRLTLTMIGACLLVLVAPRWIRAIGARAASAPLASPLVGLAAQVMVVPVLVVTVLALVISLIGIPLLFLLPFALLAFVIVWLGGFAGIAGHVGGGVRRGPRTLDSAVLDVACGVWLIGSVTLLGRVLALVPFLGPGAALVSAAGLIIEYLAWTAGLGAALTVPFRDRWSATPPPVPAPASGPTLA